MEHDEEIFMRTNREEEQNTIKSIVEIAVRYSTMRKHIRLTVSAEKALKHGSIRFSLFVRIEHSPKPSEKFQMNAFLGEVLPRCNDEAHHSRVRLIGLLAHELFHRAPEPLDWVHFAVVFRDEQHLDFVLGSQLLEFGDLRKKSDYRVSVSIDGKNFNSRSGRRDDLIK